jgi:hypothetical protein
MLWRRQHGGCVLLVVLLFWATELDHLDDPVEPKETAMTPFDWNGLQIGDKVLVHDQSSDEHFPLRSATVMNVDLKRRVHAVGIRVPNAVPSGSAVIWPTRSQVHLDPRDPSERCWRCEVDARSAG